MAEFYTTAELAERWHYARRTIRRMAKDGKIPGSTRFGDGPTVDYRFDKNAIHQHERNRRTA